VGETRNNEDTGFAVRRTFERSFAPGAVIYEAGDAGDGLYVIVAGQVELQRSGPEGLRPGARYGPGDFFGEMAVLLSRPHTARAIAVGETRVLELDRETFESMCVEQPEIAVRVIRRLGARLIDLEHRLAALGVDDLLGPVVRVLVRRADATEADARVDVTLRGIAEDAGLSLLDAHRALSQLLERKLVRLLDDVLLVPDLEALSAALD